MNNSTHDSALSATGRFGRFSYLAWNCLVAIVTVLIGGGLMAIFPNLFMDMETGNFGSGVIILIIIYIVT